MSLCQATTPAPARSRPLFFLLARCRSTMRRMISRRVDFFFGVVLAFVLVSAALVAQKAEPVAPKPSKADERRAKADEKWVRDTLEKMSLDEKVGQLIATSIDAVYASTDSDVYEKKLHLVRDLHVGAMLVSDRRLLREAAEVQADGGDRRHPQAVRAHAQLVGLCNSRVGEGSRDQTG